MLLGEYSGKFSVHGWESDIIITEVYIATADSFWLICIGMHQLKHMENFTCKRTIKADICDYHIHAQLLLVTE